MGLTLRKIAGFLLALLMLAVAGSMVLLMVLFSLTSRLNQRRLLLGLALGPPAVGLVVVYALLVSTGATRLPSQPLSFPHDVHAGRLSIACLACHRGAATDLPAGFPSLEQCMFCHRVVGKGNAQIERLVTAFQNGQPLNWLRLNRLPDHVHFDHGAHFQAGVSCATCHGAVETMKEIKRVRSLKMGDCQSCHRGSGAATSCSACHY